MKGKYLSAWSVVWQQFHVDHPKFHRAFEVNVSIAPPTSQLKKQRHRYLLKVRQSIKGEKQHFLTHLHHLEPHTADLSCSPSSGYTCSSIKLQVGKKSPQTNPTKMAAHCKKEQCLIKDLQHLLQLCLGNENFSTIKSSLASARKLKSQRWENNPSLFAACTSRFPSPVTKMNCALLWGVPGSIPVLQLGKQAHWGEGFASGHSESVKHSSSSAANTQHGTRGAKSW